MSRRVFVLISIVGLALFASGELANDDSAKSKDAAPASPQLLEVKVYYESLCPDSKKFIRNQLHSAMIDNDWLQYTNLKFVPYGKVKRSVDPQTKETTLNCQHGNAECEFNALHACVVEHNIPAEQVEVINCMMSSMFSNIQIDTCASNFNVNVDDAKQCKDTRSTPDILEKYGADTDSIDIKFVPSIAMDGVFDRLEQNDILNNFSGVFCKKYKEKYGILLNNC